MMSVLDCRTGIRFSRVLLKGDLDMFLTTVPSCQKNTSQKSWWGYKDEEREKEEIALISK